MFSSRAASEDMSRDKLRQNFTVAGHEALGSVAAQQMFGWASFSSNDTDNHRKEAETQAPTASRQPVTRIPWRDGCMHARIIFTFFSWRLILVGKAQCGVTNNTHNPCPSSPWRRGSQPGYAIPGCLNRINFVIQICVFPAVKIPNVVTLFFISRSEFTWMFLPA